MSTLRVASDSFPEMDELKAILVAGGTWFEQRTIGEVRVQEHVFPVLTASSIGSTDGNAPAIGFFGGGHGPGVHRHTVRALIHACVVASARMG